VDPRTLSDQDSNRNFIGTCQDGANMIIIALNCKVERERQRGRERRGFILFIFSNKGVENYASYFLILQALKARLSKPIRTGHHLSYRRELVAA
jgi:hypothetical protein